MIRHGNFHDGFFDGLMIEGENAVIFLRELSGKRFAMLCEGVLALSATDFLDGNILFGVYEQNGAEITEEHIRTAFSINNPYNPEGDKTATEACFRKVRERDAKVLEMSPTYGAYGLVFAKSFHLVPFSDWLMMTTETLA